MITVASTTVKTRIIIGRSIIIMNRRFSLSRWLGLLIIEIKTDIATNRIASFGAIPKLG